MKRCDRKAEYVAPNSFRACAEHRTVETEPMESDYNEDWIKWPEDRFRCDQPA